MEIVQRNDIEGSEYTEIFNKESHHTHEVIRDEHGTLRWKENKMVNELIDKMDLNYLVHLLHELGFGKNSEVYRKMYRDMGYSLSGYWEIFYWGVNNEFADSYEPNKK